MASRTKSTTNGEAILAFVAELSECKKAIPPRKFNLPSVVTHASIQKAVDGLYTTEEREKLQEINNHIFERYEIVTYEDLVKPLTPLPPITDELLEQEHIRKVTLSWSGGNVRYHMDHREKMKYSDEDKEKLISANVRTDPLTGKIQIDLRCADLKTCDLRFVKFHGNNLQRINFEEAWLDFAQISNCKAEGASFVNSSAIGISFGGSYLNGSNFNHANLCGAKGGSIFDGSIICHATFCGMTMHKGGNDTNGLRIGSRWQACKIKGADFRGSVFKPDSIKPPPPHKFTGSAFQGANFQGVDFGGVGEFRYCQMSLDARGANFSRCDLRNAVGLDSMTYEPLPSVRQAPRRPGSACGALAKQILRQVIDGDEDDDDDEIDDVDDDDTGAEGEGIGYSLLEGTQEEAEAAIQDSLLDLAEQGGNAMGTRAMAISAELEKSLQRKFASADKQWQAQLDSALVGLKAQARCVRCKNPTERTDRAKRFDMMRWNLEKMATGKISQSALDMSLHALKENASPSALAKLLSAQIKRKTNYDVRGFFPMAHAVLTTNPSRIHSDSNEIRRLLAKFEKLDQPVLETTWTELTDNWVTLHEEYSRMQTERGKLIIEQIFDNVKIKTAVGVASELRNIGHINQPPEDLLIFLKEAKVELKRRVDDYQIAADAEMVRMERIRAKQQQLVGGISIILLSVGTGICNFASNYLYGHWYGSPMGPA